MPRFRRHALRALRAISRPLPWLTILVVTLWTAGPAWASAHVSSAWTDASRSEAARLERVAPEPVGQLQPPASVPGLVGVVLRSSPSPESTGARDSGHASAPPRLHPPTWSRTTQVDERVRASLARGGVTPYFPTAPPTGR